MGKQAKAKPASQKGRNDNRPNGKRWKKKWGNNPPTELSQIAHNETIRRRSK